MTEAATDTNLSFKPENFAADIAKLQAQITPPVEVKPEAVAVPVVTQTAIPTTPVQPEPATVTKPEATKVEVPEKFQAADGSIDKEKLSKSIVNVDEALATYLQKEKELKRKINEVKAQENAYINPPANIAPAPVIPVNTNFAAQLEADIAKDGAGVVLAKLFTAAQESVEERVQKEISGLKNVNAENTTKQQVEAIGKNDPWVYTPEGMATLTRVLEEQPYLWNAADPYKAAYLQYQGQNSVASKLSSQVSIPTPTARASAPVLTAQAANIAPVQTVRLETREQIDAHLSKLTPQEQSEFFKKMGLPAF